MTSARDLTPASAHAALTETRYQAVFDQSPIGICLLDNDLRFTQMNAIAQAINGDAADTLGRPLSEVMHRLWRADDVEAVLMPFRTVLATGTPFQARSFPLTKRGSDERHYFDWEIRRLTWTDGVVIGLLCTFIEVTDHVRDREQLAASEARFSQLAESVPQLVWSTDASGRFSYANQRWTDYTGLDLAASQTTDWRSIVHPDDYDQVMTSWQRVFARGEPYQIEFRMRRLHDGEYRWHLIRAWPRRGADGAITQWDGTSTDIHDLKLVTRALEESQERWRFMADSMPQKIFTATPTGEVDYFNAQWMEYTGLSFEQIRSWGWTQFIHPDDVAENIRRWKHAIATGEPFLFEHRFRRADGAFRWHLSRAHAMRNAAGAITMWLGSNTDIDDQKRIQANLGRSNAELEQFAAIASHDLKEPLRMVTSYLALIDRRYREQLDDQGREFIRFAVDGAKRMQRLIDAIMAYSKVARPGQVLTAVDANRVLEDTRAILQEQIAATGAVVTSEPLPLVQVDPLQLARVFQNLIGNALKFCRDRAPVIRISAVSAGDLSVFTIADNGIGIPEADLPQVFEMFRRHHLQEDIPGTGIGLATCRKIIENHRGTIWVESKVGVGTTFFFSVPTSQPMNLFTVHSGRAEPMRRDDLAADERG